MEKAKILIVDDEEDFLFFVKLNLEKTGKYEVRAITDPFVAMRAVETFKPDLAVLDIMMPEMDGGELAWRLRNKEESKNTPVIFLTALLNSREERSQINTRREFMSKPISIDELIKRIDRVLARK
ncbi:MAG: response regulator [Syntrophaceae bacterium]